MAFAGFYAVFLTTVVIVAITAMLGRLGRRAPHLSAALVSALALAYTVYLAENLGRAWVIPRSALVIHLIFANSGALAFLVVVFTGARLWRRDDPGRRRLHRRMVVLFLVMVVLAGSTGTWMLQLAQPR